MERLDYHFTHDGKNWRCNVNFSSDHKIKKIPKESLELINKVKYTSIRKSIPGRWCNIAISTVIGFAGYSLIFEKQGLPGIIAAFLMMIVILVFQYYKTGVLPLIYRPTETLLSPIKSELKQEVRHNPLLIIVVFSGIFAAFTFVFIEALELRDNGHTWAPFAFGGYLAALNLILLEHSRIVALKRCDRIINENTNI